MPSICPLVSMGAYLCAEIELGCRFVRSLRDFCCSIFLTTAISVGAQSTLGQDLFA